MNQTMLKGKWNELKGNVKEQWGKLTDDDLTRAEGNYEQLVGAIQQRYGYEKEQAEREVDQWMQNQS